MAVDKIENKMIGYHFVSFEGTTPSGDTEYNTTVPGLYVDSTSPYAVAIRIKNKNNNNWYQISLDNFTIAPFMNQANLRFKLTTAAQVTYSGQPFAAIILTK